MAGDFWVRGGGGSCLRPSRLRL
ncbi:unnamed protein product [Linum tenue]|uniref:Uncharacterized protein n=1 Tax=Linum tenue TaxID=586396 RepID=A0AAV0LJG1_9ROSI|nr:unnamed protein product [Linum tenue]